MPSPTGDEQLENMTLMHKLHIQRKYQQMGQGIQE